MTSTARVSQPRLVTSLADRRRLHQTLAGTFGTAIVGRATVALAPAVSAATDDWPASTG